MLGDPKTLALAFFGGIIPSLIWLWFWLKEDKKKEEPKGLLTLVFIMGMLAVFVVLPIQKFIQMNVDSHQWELIGFAAAEEIVKLLAVMILVRKTYHIDEPLDWPIYLITGALGFAALENMFFLLKPLALGETIVGLITGHLRFLGATLLHSVASGIIGISLGLSFFKHGFTKKIYLIWGIVIATVLHSIFNFFIIKNNGSDFLKIFAFLWVITIIVILLFERLRRMSK